MFLDILSERGYRACHERQVRPIPQKFDLKTGEITLSEMFSHHFEVRFLRPEIRRED